MFSAPDDDVLQHVPFLSRHDDFVHEPGAQARRQETHAHDRPLRFQNVSYLADQHQFDESAVDGRGEHPQTRMHVDRMLVNLDNE